MRGNLGPHKIFWALTRHGKLASDMLSETRRDTIKRFFDGDLKWFNSARRNSGYDIRRVRVTLLPGRK